MTLHLTEQSAALRLRQGRLLVELDQQILTQMPARKVRCVVVWGNVRLTTPALTFLLRNQVPILFNSLDGAFYGAAVPHALAPAARLRAQFNAASSIRLRLAKAFVLSKLCSSQLVLGRFAPRHPSVREILAQLEGLSAKLEAATELDRLRGYEGIIARLYYQALQSPLSPYGFTGRNRRPPRDPVNAALSYGYALLLARVQLAVHSVGLHPEVGMLHAESRRNPALCLDLIEEFRVPVIDLTVMRAFMQGVLKPLEHFEDKAHGIYLNEAGRKVLIRLFEERLTQEATHPAGWQRPFAATIEHQAQLLAAALMQRGEYLPYHLLKP
ncbi:MAG: CRISPR-associated endonuclease Cas1 [Truepera sp.]|nr:CRISPR-associated endonuclease Cas1 [Truepera sp.]